MFRFMWCLVFVATAAMAEEVILDQAVIDFKGDAETVLVRTDKTPTTVTLRTQLESYTLTCVERGIVVVDGPHASCGQYTSQVLYCRNFSMDSYSCTDPSPWDGWSTVIHDRSCVHEEIGCVQLDRVSHGLKEEVFTIKFKNLPKLKAQQRDEFKLDIRDWAAGSTVARSSYHYAHLSTKKTLRKYRVSTSNRARHFEVKKTFLGL